MKVDEKTRFSFAGIAISFFILIVLPLTIMGVLISRGVVKVGEEATQANLRVLDDRQKHSIEIRTINLSEVAAQFLAEMEKDIRIASILPRNADTYLNFLDSNSRGVVKKSGVGVVKVPVPIYREITFLDKAGMEILKINPEGAAGLEGLKDMSNSENGESGEGDCFLKAKVLAPGEFYMGPIVGRHINKAEFDAGDRFGGVMHVSTPVFDSSGFAGVVVLTLNVVHLMEFTDHIVPTEPGLVCDIDIDNGNYSFMVDRDGFIISHPCDWFINGLDEEMRLVPVMTEHNYKELIASGKGAMNVRYLGFLDENLPKIHRLASMGQSGSLTYTLGETRMFMTYAPIPYYGNGFTRPAGFGWIGMVVDIDKYHHLSQERVEEIQQKVARWQKASITVVIVSLIIVFFIALILARGIYRSISRVQEYKNVPPVEEEDRDD
ncbi:MAG: hypothetical protein U9P49_08460 [Thermodesulfobacteriota bacterium]|nr:hypothetical protein [Thermodesulfobacteriota bacterium]